MKLKTALLAMALFGGFQSFCQQQKADSVIALFAHLPNDSTKIKALVFAANQLASTYPQPAVLVSNYVIALSKKTKYSYGLALGYAELGHAYERFSNNDSAFLCFFKSLKLFTKIGKATGQAHTLFYLGELHDIIGNFDSAAYYAYWSLRISEELSNTNLVGKNYRIIGNILSSQKRLNDALQHYFMALAYLAKENNLPDVIARVHENIALVYITQKKYADAEKHFEDASKTYIGLKEARGLARVNLNMATLNTAQGKYNQAISATKYALDFYTKINHSNGIAEALNQLSDTYFMMKRYEESIAYANQTLAILERHFDRELELTALKLLEKSYFEIGQYEEAHHYLEKAASLSDSIYSAKKKAIISELETRFKMQEKENEIELLHSEKELSLAKLRQQEVMRNAILIGGSLLLVIGILFFFFYRTVQLQKQQAERVRISSDLHDEIGSTLSSVGIISAFATKKIDENKPDEAKKILGEITASTSEMAETINDIVWALNPKNDDFESTINRLHNFASRSTEGKNINLNFTLHPHLEKTNLSMSKRKNLLLICKEAINNAVKSSQCQNLTVIFLKKKKQLRVSIQDDGVGFNLNKTFNGNGLKTMKYRATQMDANFYITSAPKKGTHITVLLKI